MLTKKKYRKETSHSVTRSLDPTKSIEINQESKKEERRLNTTLFVIVSRAQSRFKMAVFVEDEDIKVLVRI